MALVLIKSVSNESLDNALIVSKEFSGGLNFFFQHEKSRPPPRQLDDRNLRHWDDGKHEYKLGTRPLIDFW